jgi:hypothetical protein
MASNAIFFGWNRSIPGREALSAEHFTQFISYLNGLKVAGMITEFDAVFLTPHGGDMNGFFLIKGKNETLHAVLESQAWVEHMTRASLHLEGSGAVTAAVDGEVMERMQVWTKSIPRS